MIINDKRALAYNTPIVWVKPIDGADNIELVGILGWTCIAKKGEFQPGDTAIYFEIDSKLPVADWSAFMESKHYKVKTMRLGKFNVVSQGLALPTEAFGEELSSKITNAISEGFRNGNNTVDLTELLGVTYSVEEDNKRKADVDPNAKYVSMKARHKKFFSNKLVKKLMKHEWFRRFIFVFLGKKKDNPKGWPVGKFPGVSKTDQERCENMPWVLEDKTPYIVTQKCDGSSATYILERKARNKFEFYVCSRNVRMRDETQESFHNNKGEKNVYWEMAFKYSIEEKMKQYLIDNNTLSFVCWQGEICGPNIQKNPHKLTCDHLFMFHWTDDRGRLNILEADKLWRKYDCEVVPIVNINFILPDDMETFKQQADGDYDKSVCEGNTGCKREGFVYYKTTDSTFSFKNVSREYLLKHNG